MKKSSCKAVSEISHCSQNRAPSCGKGRGSFLCVCLPNWFYSISVEKDFPNNREFASGQIDELAERRGFEDPVQCQENEKAGEGGGDQARPGGDLHDDPVEFPGEEARENCDQWVGEKVAQLAEKTVLQVAAGKVGVCVDADERKRDFGPEHRCDSPADEDDDLDHVKDFLDEFEKKVKVRPSHGF